MIYLIYYSWKNTNTNHAGMKYLCETLSTKYPETYKAIEYKYPQIIKIKSNNYFEQLINKALTKIKTIVNNRRVHKKYTSILNDLNLDNDDKVILMEYMDRSVHQDILAKILKANYPTIKVFGLSHFVPELLDKMFDKRKLVEWDKKVDFFVTLGSSLTDYYINRGINPKKLITTFHYVDDYYLNLKPCRHTFKVLVQGSMMRDMDTLKRIVESNQDITFIICQGFKDLSGHFKHLNNVILKSFLSESELRQLMMESPVSLNVMKDTIGSNVITTSMGMGQAMVCSDVGSIKDYCTDKNTIFCKSIDDFNNALTCLRDNPEVCENMQKESVALAERFTIPNFSIDLIKKIGRHD